MHSMVRIATFLFALALQSTAARAQAPATVLGRVVDQTGAPLPGVTIDLETGGKELTAVTDADGRFTFTAVTAGLAELTFRLINFSVVRRVVTVTTGAQTVNAALSVALNADVIVTAAGTFRNVADVDTPAENLVGIAVSSSQGAITAAQLQARPIMRAGEVLETVPGMVVSQHSGEGKANQYYLRGFNLDHGTDFSTTVAGVPVNTPTGAHAHGYADTSFLIPELVSGVQFKKGTYFADEGDFSAAGAANINYTSQLDRPMASLTGGGQGFGRAFAAASPRIGRGYLLGAVELGRNDGPWDRPDGYQKANAVVRYSQGDVRNGFSLTGMSYAADWDSTDQVAQRAIDSGLISRFGNLDASNGGRSRRHSVASEYQRSSGDSALRANAYVLRNELNLFSNFTYFLDDEENGDQFEQAERRTSIGGRLGYRRLGHTAGHHTESAIGMQVRHDWLSPVGLYHSAERARLSTTREDRVSQTMAGAYAQTEIEWHRQLRTTFGVRADLYRFGVTSNLAANSGDGSAAMVSPKFSSVFGPFAGTEFYLNAGMGFHSNDARGATIAIDPLSGEAADQVTPLVRATGAEIGVRTVQIKGLQLTLTGWYLGLDSELLFVGDAGTTEAGRPSRRLGVEWANYLRINSWLTADLDVAHSRARFRDDDSVGQAIPGALDRVVTAGITAEPSRRVSGSVRVRHFGPRPLIEDASVKSASTTLWNGEIGARVMRRARLVLEGYNLSNAAVADIDYYYPSRLPGEPAGGVDDIHTHPALPRTARLSLQLLF
ncbi:MAG: TonB-dependent receptor [Acidimicrobiia bacterium]